jgi:hypothetical protein
VPSVSNFPQRQFNHSFVLGKRVHDLPVIGVDVGQVLTVSVGHDVAAGDLLNSPEWREAAHIKPMQKKPDMASSFFCPVNKGTPLCSKINLSPEQDLFNIDAGSDGSPDRRLRLAPYSYFSRSGASRCCSLFGASCPMSYRIDPERLILLQS